MKLELLNLCFLSVSKLILIVLVKIKKRIALGFTLVYKTPFCKPEMNNFSLAIYKN